MKIAETTKTKVTNINETPDKTCSCKSWLTHWERFSGNTAKECAEIKCQSDAEVGAHVIKVGDSNESQYIIPLCIGHHQHKNQCFEIEGKIVSADVNETCNKDTNDKFKKTRSLS